MYQPIPCSPTRTGSNSIFRELKPGFNCTDIDVSGNLDAPIYMATSGSWVCARIIVPNSWVRHDIFRDLA